MNKISEYVEECNSLKEKHIATVNKILTSCLNTEVNLYWFEDGGMNATSGVLKKSGNGYEVDDIQFYDSIITSTTYNSTTNRLTITVVDYDNM